MGDRVPRFAALPVGVVVAVQAVVLTALSGRYDFHRDEFYFRVAGEHLAWGYVDQPPATPLLAHVSLTLFGDTPAGLRVMATLAGMVTVVLVALAAREFGGGRGAQLFAAIATALSSYVLVVSHMLATNSLDMVLWTAITLCALRLWRTGDGRWWLAIGALTGVALANKWLVFLLLLGFGVGVLIAGPRAVLRTWWLAGGVGVALALAAPVVIWQATHGFPLLTVANEISAGQGGENRALLVPMQLVYLSPVLVPVWIAGLIRPWRDPSVRWARALTIAYPVVLLALLILGGKPYYGVAPLLPLVALGADLALRWLRGGLVRRVVLGVLAVLAVMISVVVSLPVVPASSLQGVLLAVNKEPGEQVGWPEFTDAVARGWSAIPASERSLAVILAGNYGEAGAVDYYGPARGLPRPYSPHMSYAGWGPPPDSSTGPVLVIGRPGQWFTGCRVVATHHNAAGIDNDEEGVEMSLCTVAGPWSRIWPSMRRY